MTRKHRNGWKSFMAAFTLYEEETWIALNLTGSWLMRTSVRPLKPKMPVCKNSCACLPGAVLLRTALQA